MAGIA